MTANYRARKHGIHSALPISRAWQFAEAARKRGEPATVFFIQPNMALYREVSSRIMQIIQRYADTFRGCEHRRGVPRRLVEGKFRGRYRTHEAAQEQRSVAGRASVAPSA